MCELLARTIKTELGELIKLSSEVHSFLETCHVSSDTVYKIDLALEEMCTNVIKYGYDHISPDNSVTVEIDKNHERVCLTISDRGHAFDPVAYDHPELDEDISGRPVGGVGIHLTRSMVDAMNYCRKDDKNILEIKVNL